jgi:hypothetical protein
VFNATSTIFQLMVEEIGVLRKKHRPIASKSGNRFNLKYTYFYYFFPGILVVQMTKTVVELNVL